MKKSGGDTWPRVRWIPQAWRGKRVLVMIRADHDELMPQRQYMVKYVVDPEGLAMVSVVAELMRYHKSKFWDKLPGLR